MHKGAQRVYKGPTRVNKRAQGAQSNATKRLKQVIKKVFEKKSEECSNTRFKMQTKKCESDVKEV